MQNTDTVPNDKRQSIDTSHFVDPSRQQQKGKANLYSLKVYIAKINCICFRQWLPARRYCTETVQTKNRPGRLRGCHQECCLLKLRGCRRTSQVQTFTWRLQRNGRCGSLYTRMHVIFVRAGIEQDFKRVPSKKQVPDGKWTRKPFAYRESKKFLIYM